MDLARKLVAGIGKHLSSATSLTLESTVYTPSQLATALETLVDLYSAADTAKAVVKAKLAAVKVQGPALLKLMAALESYVRLTFGGSLDVMADFGVAPRKAPTPLSTEKLAVAIAKRNATREARGTTGKKAKRAIKGNVVDVTLTPVVAGKPVAESPPAPSVAAPVGGATTTTSGTTSHGV
jgi:hypothetical protein